MSNVASFFLKLTIGQPGAGEKRILGEATDASYKHQIEISGFNWDLARTSASSSATGSSASRLSTSVEPSILKFSKPMCRATSGMLSAMETGELLTAVFTLEEDSDTDFKLELTLTKVRILDYSMEMDETEVKENWQAEYEIVRFDYTPNYKSGALTVSLTRHAGASTESPGDQAAAGKIHALAQGMKPAELKPLIKKLEQLAKAGPSSAAPTKTTGGVKG